MASPTSSSARRPSRSSGPFGRGDFPRVVVDACALPPSIVDPDNLYEAIIDRQSLVPVFCPEMLCEARLAIEVMLERLSFLLTERDYRAIWEAFDFVQRVAASVPSPPPGFTVEELGPHQKDAHLFWTCEQGDACVVITVEPRLWHELRMWRGIPILKPTDALAWLARRFPS